MSVSLRRALPRAVAWDLPVSTDICIKEVER